MPMPSLALPSPKKKDKKLKNREILISRTAVRLPELFLKTCLPKPAIKGKERKGEQTRQQKILIFISSLQLMPYISIQTFKKIFEPVNKVLFKFKNSL